MYYKWIISGAVKCFVIFKKTACKFIDLLNFFYTIVYFFIGVCYRKRLLMARKNMSANCQSTDRQKYLKKIRQEQDIIIYWSFGKKSFKMLSTCVIQTSNCI